MTTGLIKFNHLSCHSSSTAFGTKAIIELTRLKCKQKGNQKEKGTDETPCGRFAAK